MQEESATQFTDQSQHAPVSSPRRRSFSNAVRDATLTAVHVGLVRIHSSCIICIICGTTLLFQSDGNFVSMVYAPNLAGWSRMSSCRVKTALFMYQFLLCSRRFSLSCLTPKQSQLSPLSHFDLGGWLCRASLEQHCT